MTSVLGPSKSGIRKSFFDLLFGANEGFVCLAVTDPELPKASFRQSFYEWPKQAIKVENFILSVEKQHNVYFGINLLSKMERKKENCLPTNLLWADLDTASIERFKIPPPILLESSPGRRQAIWRLTTSLDPWQAEEYSKQIAYSIEGADRSGWDLTQLLRVPLTTNFKYTSHPKVALIRALETEAAPLLFEAIPKVKDTDDIPSKEKPADSDLPDAREVIYKYTVSLRNSGFTAFYSTKPAPDGDWSSALWRLIHICFEAGMNANEVFSVAQTAACNKYARDGRPIEHLWRDVLKAEKSQEAINVITANFAPLIMPKLVDEPATETFLDQYSEWASEATDAVEIFHRLAAITILSAIVAGSVRLETSYGLIVPNLWGLVLGDSTLTRKTTAMRMAIDFLNVLDAEMIMATDGSPEGLLTGLESRPNKVSIFYKDEISGFFNAINRRDYLAGMPETLTHLYDVPSVYTRRLTKHTIRLESPVFIFFGGGVEDRVYDALTEEYILSGFMPRFLVVAGDNDIDSLRRTGPPLATGVAKRAAISEKMANLYECYAMDVKTNIGGQIVMMPSRVMATLTDKAWAMYGNIEDQMVREAANSSIPSLALPTFERLSRSLLKMAVILGASRQSPATNNNQISITDSDVQNAAWYVQDWGQYSVNLVANAGKKASEKLLDKIIRVISEHPGILRSTISQHYHLDKQEADRVLGTLEDRMLVRGEKAGRGVRYFIT
jgi:Protein of unknown function (DUF3987)